MIIRNNMKDAIQQRLESPASLTLQDGSNFRDYSEKDLFHASHIFMTILMDFVYSQNIQLPQEDKLILAENVGKTLRKLIKDSSGLDMHDIVKKVLEI